jgi:hypothetical protein
MQKIMESIDDKSGEDEAHQTEAQLKQKEEEKIYYDDFLKIMMVPK